MLGGQRSKMFLPAGNLGALLMAKVIPPTAAFGFHDKIKFLVALIFDHNDPIRIIGPQWCWDFEPGG